MLRLHSVVRLTASPNTFLIRRLSHDVFAKHYIPSPCPTEHMVHRVGQGLAEVADEELRKSRVGGEVAGEKLWRRGRVWQRLAEVANEELRSGGVGGEVAIEKLS